MQKVLFQKQPGSVPQGPVASPPQETLLEFMQIEPSRKQPGEELQVASVSLIEQSM